MSECPGSFVEVFARPSYSPESVQPESLAVASSLEHFRSFSQCVQAEADTVNAKFDTPSVIKPKELSSEQIASRKYAEYVSALGVNLCSARNNCRPSDFALAA